MLHLNTVSCRNGGEMCARYDRRAAVGIDQRRAEGQMFESLTGERVSNRQRVVWRRGGALVLLAVLALIAANSVACVRTGHVGVVTVFGRVTGRTMGEGIHLVNPVSR